MIRLLFVPMTLCLLIGFVTWGMVAAKTWSTPRVFYPKTLLALRNRMLADANAGYLYRHYSTWCSIAGGKLLPEDFAVISLVGAVVGFIGGLCLSNLTMSLCLFLLFLLLPTLMLYARYTVRMNAMIKSFGQFVDLFSRHYSNRKSILPSFRDMLEECPKQLENELILLINKLTDGGNATAAIEQFAERLNHGWAQDFATYVISGLEGETKDIQASLNRLTNEMFVLEDEREERQSEIHSIWISLIIVIVICILLIPYNQTLLKDSLRLYFFTPDGQTLLAIALTIWCFCVLVAFIWGKRHE
ncbi:hypothetical protein EDM56_23205 [Brevibacillus fluminis]|uniref:Type II secretion system protein GspF domain-containing protein n=1 Tax=Brevibacillus fluminis TaxID=511487 RepID=A0A3M8D517_9BACL|nr:hypothetical protein [Brevibacillus fluminis]RNB82809.1 hypothetical protein EDM56_23205 [Brevibacillus fluminis]